MKLEVKQYLYNELESCLTNFLWVYLIITTKHVFMHAIIMYWHTLVYICMHWKPVEKNWPLFSFPFHLAVSPSFLFQNVPKARTLVCAFKQKFELDIIETHIFTRTCKYLMLWIVTHFKEYWKRIKMTNAWTDFRCISCFAKNIGRSWMLHFYIRSYVTYLFWFFEVLRTLFQF